ncbi:hypothetical protein I545_3577 [Mycobacterium kansasii 662]|uniref:Uncharacterized protein n=1 Tax=Mycobacterium kansasii 662 TaxID=1299326 RepID=X7ZDN4_MYCKA|nr:hypothetical protein I545_3577 [Mycobacterium kansasii 662]
MKLIAAHLLKSIAPVFTGLALVLASVGHGGDGAPRTPSSAPALLTAGMTKAAPAGGH